jgi:hypothetical protein
MLGPAAPATPDRPTRNPRDPRSDNHPMQRATLDGVWQTLEKDQRTRAGATAASPARPLRRKPSMSRKMPKITA